MRWISCASCCARDATDVVLMAIEGIKDGEKFKAVAREAAEREKPIVVLKFGRTEAGSRAAASHTGAIAGDDAIVDAVFRQFGLIRVDECDELYETAVLLRKRRWPQRARRGGRVAHRRQRRAARRRRRRASASSGPTYSADDAGRARAAAARLRQGRQSDRHDLARDRRAGGSIARRLNTIAADENVDIVVPIYASRLEERSSARRRLRRGLREGRGDAVGRRLHRRSVVHAQGFREGRRDGVPRRDAVHARVPRGGRFRRVRGGAQVRRARARASCRAGPRSARPRGSRAAGAKLTEREAKAVLAAYGLPVTREQLATSAGGSGRTCARDRRRRSRSRSTRPTSRTRPRRARYGWACKATTRCAPRSSEVMSAARALCARARR